jgi:dephospho-CoA kinase
MKICITGGIGSGKSYVCKCLKKRGIEVYDCDTAAKRLIQTSNTIRQQLIKLIGSDVYIGNQINKGVITKFLLANNENNEAINNIIHPEVIKDFKRSGLEWMESAILFESGINKLVDYIIIVTAPEEVRIQRVMKRNNISREQVLLWMQHQWPQEKICQLADYEIINDGIVDIDKQLDEILNNIKV